MDENREEQLDILRTLGRNFSEFFMRTGTAIPEMAEQICCACNSTLTNDEV